MTIIRDLSLSSEGRMQRRVDKLEGGYVANQQTGAWVKTIAAGGSSNGTEVFAVVPNLGYAVPATGQYEFTVGLDVSQSASGYTDVQLSIEGIGAAERLIHPANLRDAISITMGGYVEKGKAAFVYWRRFAGAGVVGINAGELVIRKIA